MYFVGPQPLIISEEKRPLEYIMKVLFVYLPQVGRSGLLAERALGNIHEGRREEQKPTSLRYLLRLTPVKVFVFSSGFWKFGGFNFTDLSVFFFHGSSISLSGVHKAKATIFSNRQFFCENFVFS